MLHRLDTLSHFIRALWSDKRTPKSSKLLPLLAVLYLVMPVDLLPDVLPLVGWIDDVGIFVVFLIIALRLIPRGVFEEHLHAQRKVIDVKPEDPP